MVKEIFFSRIVAHIITVYDINDSIFCFIWIRNYFFKWYKHPSAYTGRILVADFDVADGLALPHDDHLEHVRHEDHLVTVGHRRRDKHHAQLSGDQVQSLN